MTVGTSGNDTIASAFDFDVVSGLDGDDVLDGIHNGVILVGGLGNDVLDTTYTLAGSTGSHVQLGGDGDDMLSIDVDGNNTMGNITANFAMDGGEGADTISASIGHTSSGDTVLNSSATGGASGDNIDVSISGGGAVSSDVTSIIDAGRGNDIVGAFVESNMTAFGGTTTDAELFVDLGLGSDQLNGALLRTQTVGTSNSVATVLGGGGSDVMELEVRLASSATGGTANADIEFDGGGASDTITSVVDSNFGMPPGSAVPLDDVDVALTILGGAGTGADDITSTVDLFAIDSIRFDGVYDGGASQDTITLDQDYETSGASAFLNVDVDNAIDLGADNDTLLGDLDVNDAGQAFLQTETVSSGGGNDIDLTLRALVDELAFVTNAVTTGGGADEIDLEAFAFVKSTGATVASHVADARNLVNSGNGDDVVDISAQAQSSGDGSGGAAEGVGAYAENRGTLGGGNDMLTSGGFIFSDSNGGTGTAKFDFDLGAGNDNINSTMSSDFSELFEVSFDNDIIGGGGSDVIVSAIDGFARNIINIDSDIDGGNGNDVITSTIVTESFGTATQTVTEDISGGNGADTITTVFDSSQTPGLTGAQPILNINGDGGNDIINATIVGNKGTLTIDGGANDDTITVTSPVTTSGTHIIAGGTGNDTITGSDDFDDISGDAGEDRIVASDGSDDYWGGAISGTGDGEADTFAFDPAFGGYTVDLNDFESAFDILEFTGLTDAGAAGLVDDIDALGVFIDNGVGNKVTFDLNAGGSIDFEGAGTGSVSSIADLVNDTNLQLIA